MLLQGGYAASEIGILYPIESMWTKYMPRYHKVAGWKKVGSAREEVDKINKTFQSVPRFMFENCREYLYLDAKAIIDSKVENGILKHDKLQFKVLILPYVTTLPETAWKQLEKYVEQGGKLIALGEKPVNMGDQRLPIRLAHRKIEGEEVLFIINGSEEEINTELSFIMNGKFEEWDPATAEVTKVGNRFQLLLKPYHGKVYRSY